MSGKRKRCPICSKLFDPRGIKKHINWCVRQQQTTRPVIEMGGLRKDAEAAFRAADKATESAAGIAEMPADVAERLRIDKCAHQEAHTDAEIRADTRERLDAMKEGRAPRVGSGSMTGPRPSVEPGEIYPSVSTFESIVKELKAANLGLMIVVLD